MKVLLTVFTLLVFSACGFQNDEESGGGLVVGHVAVDDAFVISPPNSGTYNESENLNFTLTHPKEITVDTSGGTPEIEIQIGENTRTATYVSGTGTENLTFRYTIQSGEEDLDGVEILSDEINLNGGTLQYSSNGVLGEANNEIVLDSTVTEVLVDTGVPTLLFVTPPIPATYHLGDELTFIATFDSAVMVSGTPRIALNIGGVTQYANYYLGSGTSTLLFKYAIQSADFDDDGIGSSSPILDNGGGITYLIMGEELLTLVGIQQLKLLQHLILLWCMWMETHLTQLELINQQMLLIMPVNTLLSLWTSMKM